MDNKSILEQTRENTKLYHIPSCAVYQHRREDVVYTGKEMTVHKLWKYVGGMFIKDYGDVFVSDKLKVLMRELALEIDTLTRGIESFGKKDKHVFITETVPRDQDNRRVDLLDLTNDTRYEFETNKKCVRKDQGSDGTVTIYI